MGEPDFVVHYVVSLGCMCAPAKHLQRLQLRLCAGPFDWIFSTPQMVTHCLQDDFACFLRPGELFETNGVAGAGHDTYSTMIDRKVSERDQQSTAWQGRRSRKHPPSDYLQSPQPHAPGRQRVLPTLRRAIPRAAARWIGRGRDSGSGGQRAHAVRAVRIFRTAS